MAEPSRPPYPVRMRARTVVWLLGWCWATACDPEPPSSEGRACTSDDACAGLVCAPEANPAPADLAEWKLVCAARSGGAAQGEACRTSKDCSHGLCLLAGGCSTPCSDEAQCGAHSRCALAYARSSTDTLATVHACVARVDLPADARIDTHIRRAALNAGVTALDLPAVDHDSLFVLEHLDDNSWPVPDPMSVCRPPLCARKLETRAAEPQLLFELMRLPADGPDNPVANGNQVNPLTVLLPNGPRAALASEGYRLDVEAKHGGDLRVTQLSREGSAQRLDLNLYYVGARELSAEAERGGAALQAALEEVDRIFARADIFIGDVRQVEVRGALLDRGTPLPAAEVSQGFRRLRSQYQVLPQLPKLLELSAGAGNVALDVFFVADIEAIGGDVGGIAGGTPVPLGMHGTAGSGLVIASDMYVAARDAVKFGRTLAHEIAHALGLFHTTEVDGSVFDPLPDTPVCAKQRDANRDGLLDASECRDFGADNLMFPTSDATGSTLSDDQVAVLQRALILQ